MNYEFKTPKTHKWSVSEAGVTCLGTLYPYHVITEVSEYRKPVGSFGTGVVHLYVKGREKPFWLEYLNRDIKEVAIALEYVIKSMKEAVEVLAKAETGLVYSLQGVRGRYMKVYEDRVVIRVEAGIGSIITGNSTDGEKTIYYKDCIGIQFKEPGITIGYLQLETAGRVMNNTSNNFFNENSFTYDSTVQTNEKMREVVNYVKERVSDIKNRESQPYQSQVSAADEIKKFKELFDMGIITQEEFDAKKKQLLGL